MSRRSNKRALAALLVFKDAISDKEIAKKVGISPRTLYYWKQEEDFQGLVGDVSEAHYKAMVRLDIRRWVIVKLVQLAGRIEWIIKERAEDPRMDMVPGGGSGLIGVWTNAQTGAIVRWEFDAALAREYRGVIRQIDEMMGDYVSPEPEKPLDLSRLSPEDRQTLDRILKAATTVPQPNPCPWWLRVDISQASG